jgi:hypothetical protein
MYCRRKKSEIFFPFAGRVWSTREDEFELFAAGI